MLDHIARVVGRVLISIFFVTGAYRKIIAWSATTAFMVDKGIPFAPVLLALAVAIECFGGLSLLFGYRTKVGAWSLFAFILPATFILHNFWSVSVGDPHLQMIHFLKNLGIMGGLLLVAAAPPAKT